MVRVIGLGGGEFRLRPWCMGSALMLVPPEEVDEGAGARAARRFDPGQYSVDVSGKHHPTC